MPKGYSLRNQSGWKHKKESIAIMKQNRKGLTANEKNPKWKGDDATYYALHNWIRKNFDKPSLCESCEKDPGHDKAGHTKLQWANKTKNYSRERSDWICLCISCHKKQGLRIKKEHRFSHGVWNKTKQNDRYQS